MAAKQKNKQPCTICFERVNTFEGQACSECGAPLCDRNACHGAHEAECGAMAYADANL